MECSLTSIVSSLQESFSMETCGNLTRQITDIQELTPTNPPVRSDVLYVVHQSQLLKYSGAPAQGVVLCISHTRWDLHHSRTVFPAMIMVLCQDAGLVYSALLRIMYEEGSRTSFLPEISGAFLRCRSLSALVDVGFSYLGNPFAVHDSNGELVAYSRQAGLRDERWRNQDFLSTLYSFHTMENATCMEQSRREQIPVLLPTTGPEQYRMALISRSQNLGYLTVAALFHPFTEQDKQIIKLLGCFITLDLLRQGSIIRTDVSDSGSLKTFLESGDSTNPGMPQWLGAQTSAPGGVCYLLLITGRQSPAMMDIDWLLSLLDTVFPDGISTRLESGLVVFLKCETDTPPALGPLLEAMPQTLMLGVSLPFHALSESGHRALRQTRTALELGSVLHPDRNCYHFSDYSVYAALQAASATIHLQELLPPALVDLMESDAGGESLHTLEAYLAAGGKKARTAELLFIHLNTLKYRLVQLSARLGMDLDDPATLFRLEHALKIVEYLRAFGD